MAGRVSKWPLALASCSSRYGRAQRHPQGAAAGCLPVLMQMSSRTPSLLSACKQNREPGISRQALRDSSVAKQMETTNQKSSCLPAHSTNQPSSAFRQQQPSRLPTLTMGTRAWKMMSGRLRTAPASCSRLLMRFSMGPSSSRCSLVKPAGRGGGAEGRGEGAGGWVGRHAASLT